jgi:putative transcriptional regulator
MATETVEPSATLAPTPTPERTPTPTAFGASVFEDPDSCEHSSGVYRVAFPDSWWWNTSYEHAELGQIDACRFFSLDEFDITTASRGQPVPDGIAISINYHDGACLGFFNAQLSQEVSVGDFASAVGITPANIAVLKNGRARAIRFSTLESICRVLDCQPGDILRWTADPPAYRRAAAPLP